MPLYTYACPVCSKKFDIFKRLADLDSPSHCPQCLFEMQRQVTAAAVVGDYPGYLCPVTNNWIEGRKAHQENLAKHGARVLERGETAEFTRRKAAEDDAFAEKVADSIMPAVAKLSGDDQNRLGEALQKGMSAEFTRSTPNL